MSLPATIRELVALLGHGKAMALVRDFGGQNLRIPKGETSDTWHALAETLGEAAARKLVAQWGGEMLYIALCHAALKDDRRRKIIAHYERLLADGHSSTGAISILVREFAPISYRWVERIVNAPMPEAPETAVQGALF